MLPKISVDVRPVPNHAERQTMRSGLGAFFLAITFTTALGQQPATPSPKPATASPSPEKDSNRAALIVRAKSLELDTPYVPPPGDPLVHHAAGFAKVMCSAAFITGLDPDFAAENVGYFTAPYAERAKLGKPVIDRLNKRVQVSVPNDVTRTAVYLGDQGCVTLSVGNNSVSFTPLKLKSGLPDVTKQLWPVGDALPRNHYRRRSTWPK